MDKTQRTIDLGQIAAHTTFDDAFAVAKHVLEWFEVDTVTFTINGAVVRIVPFMNDAEALDAYRAAMDARP